MLVAQEAPRSTPQSRPGCGVASFVSVNAPFPHVSAEIAQAYRIRLKTSDRHRCAAASSRGLRDNFRRHWVAALFPRREFVLILRLRACKTEAISGILGSHALVNLAGRSRDFALENRSIFRPFGANRRRSCLWPDR